MELNDDVIAYGVKCAMTGANNVLDSLLYDETIETVAKTLNPDAWNMNSDLFYEEHATEEDYRVGNDHEKVQGTARANARSKAEGLLGILFIELR